MYIRPYMLSLKFIRNNYSLPFLKGDLEGLQVLCYYNSPLNPPFLKGERNNLLYPLKITPYVLWYLREKVADNVWARLPRRPDAIRTPRNDKDTLSLFVIW